MCVQSPFCGASGWTVLAAGPACITLVSSYLLEPQEDSGGWRLGRNSLDHFHYKDEVWDAGSNDELLLASLLMFSCSSLIQTELRFELIEEL